MNKVLQQSRHRSKEEWQQLGRRYFDAETTDEEERALRHFLCFDDEADASFDSLRAVMGYLAVGKKHWLHRKSIHRRRTIWHRAIAVAAVAGGIVCGSLWFFGHSEDDVCVAYIGGVKYTDTEIVMQQMQQSISKVSDVGEGTTMQGQLKDMMQTLNEGSSENK